MLAHSLEAEQEGDAFLLVIFPVAGISDAMISLAILPAGALPEAKPTLAILLGSHSKLERLYINAL